MRSRSEADGVRMKGREEAKGPIGCDDILFVWNACYFTQRKGRYEEKRQKSRKRGGKEGR